MRALLFTLSVALVMQVAGAQEPPAPGRTPEAIRKELKDARERVAALEAELAKTEKPGETVPIDWDLVPVEGDKDYRTKSKELNEKYNGKMVSVSGTMVIRYRSTRMIRASVAVKVQRGEVLVDKVIVVVFQDTDGKRLDEAAKAGVVTVAGKAEGGSVGLLIQDSKLIAVPPAPAKK